MKQIIFIFIGLLSLLGTTGFAQNSGVISYSIHDNLSHWDTITTAVNAKSADLKVYFNEDYAKIVNEDTGEGQTKMLGSLENVSEYIDLKNGNYIAVIEKDGKFYGKTEAIEKLNDSLATNETENLLGREVTVFEDSYEQKFQTKNDSIAKKKFDTSFWVDATLPKRIAPSYDRISENGTLLKCDMGYFVYEAVDVSFEEVSNETVAPVAFTTVDDEEYMNLIKELFEKKRAEKANK